MSRDFLRLRKTAATVRVSILYLSIQEAQVMLTNPRDAIRGQSRSRNIVQFHMLGVVSY